MNWTRILLDGLAMAAYFNFFAAAVVLYNPRLMFPSYPPAIIKAAPQPPTASEKKFYWIWILAGELLPLLLYGSIGLAQMAGLSFGQLFLAGYVQWMCINVGDLLFLDGLLMQGLCRDRFVIAGTEGHPGYSFSRWMRSYALPEHLLQWPLAMCPLMALAQAGLALLCR
ncbi:MAG: hypothetical protein Q4C56_06180 [Peptococcaceae bacterium]|nr:hypothetical protein [Peptococcaceae bacterium]